ncbi:aspartic peptidase domain-containing protein [Lactifluus volemus]|nr:aspartic peptidase domain-containing protein [Lactifluus volemus]
MGNINHGDSRGHVQVNLSEDARAVDDTIDAADVALIYTASVGVGSPPTDYVLVIDTGSSNTWVGANKKYRKTGTSRKTGNNVTVGYGSGSFTGTEFTDQVTLSPSLISSPKPSALLPLLDILGIGPVNLTPGTIGGETPVPTITDNLFKQGTIATESIGIQVLYQPPTSTCTGILANRELRFGDFDSSKIIGDVNYVPITSTSPASRYWGIDQGITYGSSGESILSLTSGIVDTGTTLIHLATAEEATNYRDFLVSSRKTGYLTITASQYENLQSLYFNIGGTSYKLTSNAQIWPRSIYLVVTDLHRSSGQGLDFINGFAFLQRYYSVYDVTNSQLGLAATSFTNSETN